MLAALIEIPENELDWDRWAFHNRDQIEQSQKAVEAAKGITLTKYIIYPIRMEQFGDFLQNNAAAHKDMLDAMGLPGSDISAVDPEDREALKEWIWENYTELRELADTLGI